MPAIADLDEFRGALRKLVRATRPWRAEKTVEEVLEDFRDGTKDCYDEIEDEYAAHGVDPHPAYFNLIISDGVALVTIFDAELCCYVLRCKNEHAMINAFEDNAEKDGLSMEDVEACRRILASQYKKKRPDLVLAADKVNEWLS